MLNIVSHFYQNVLTLHLSSYDETKNLTISLSHDLCFNHIIIIITKEKNCYIFLSKKKILTILDCKESFLFLFCITTNDNVIAEFLKGGRKNI